MNKEDIEPFLNKFVKLNLEMEKDRKTFVLYFSGTVKKVTESSIHLIDKFEKLVVLDISTIKTISEIDLDE